MKYVLVILALLLVGWLVGFAFTSIDGSYTISPLGDLVAGFIMVSIATSAIVFGATKFKRR